MKLDSLKIAARCVSLALCTLPLLPAGAEAVTVTYVHSFSNTPDGASPQGGLVMGADGALYGTTQYGGVYGIDPKTNAGNGTIFRIAPDNSYSVVYSFTHLAPNRYSNVDGRWPNRGLLAAPDGWLYGVTPYGGKNDSGAVFKFSPSNGFAPLHYFGAPSDVSKGTQPEAPLALGLDGRLYGTTQYGGRQSQGLGVVFGLAIDGQGFKVSKSFGQGAGMPESRLLAASDGLLYGIAATYQGYVGGALYRMTPDGSQYQVVHAFNYATEGGFYYVGTLPPPIDGGDGYLYGATADGGTGDGAIYRVARDGSGFSILHAFAALGSGGVNVGGGRVHTPLIFGSDGNLYGATQSGGSNGSGVVYRLARDGSGFTTLYNFPAATSQAVQPAGTGPMGDIVFNASGQLCGTAYGGGAHNGGAVYCLTLD